MRDLSTGAVTVPASRADVTEHVVPEYFSDEV